LYGHGITAGMSKEEQIKAGAYEFKGKLMIGGCLNTFARRDALKRHVDNPKISVCRRHGFVLLLDPCRRPFILHTLDGCNMCLLFDLAYWQLYTLDYNMHLRFGHRGGLDSERVHQTNRWVKSLGLPHVCGTPLSAETTQSPLQGLWNIGDKMTWGRGPGIYGGEVRLGRGIPIKIRQWS
jgi:hypothetical protein